MRVVIVGSFAAARAIQSRVRAALPQPAHVARTGGTHGTPPADAGPRILAAADGARWAVDVSRLDAAQIPDAAGAGALPTGFLAGFLQDPTPEPTEQEIADRLVGQSSSVTVSGAGGA